jgi:hypothetical protein
MSTGQDKVVEWARTPKWPERRRRRHREGQPLGKDEHSGPSRSRCRCGFSPSGSHGDFTKIATGSVERRAFGTHCSVFDTDRAFFAANPNDKGGSNEAFYAARKAYVEARRQQRRTTWP